VVDCINVKNMLQCLRLLTFCVQTRAVDLIALTRAINALKKFAIKNFNALIVRVN
jgi:hypothetical protein